MDNKYEVLQDCILDGQKVEIGAIVQIDDVSDPDVRRAIQANVLKRVVLENTQRFLAASYAGSGAAMVHKARHSVPGNGGFSNLGELLKCIRDVGRGHADARLKGLTEGVGSDGGFAVPSDFSQEILREVLDDGGLLGRCRQVPVSSNAVRLPAVDETSRAANVFGGIWFTWTGEAATLDESQPKFRQIGMQLHKLSGLCAVSNEMLEDSFALSALLPSMMAEGLRFQLADVVLHGVGGGQPLGILNSPAKVVVAKEASQAAATIKFENVLKMSSRLAPSSARMAAWFINPSTLPALFTMNVAVRNLAGTDNVGGGPVFLPGTTLRPASLFGFPVLITELCKPLGTEGDIILADLSQYLLASHGDLRLDTSPHAKFASDETMYRISYRIDGQPWWNAPRTPRYGSETVSPFVVLESRS